MLPDNNMNLRNVKVVLGQDNYHLLFPVEYKKGKRNGPWAVKTELGRMLSGPLPKIDVAQVAATSHVAAEDDSLGAQIKTWFSMESYATRVNVSGRWKDDKSAPKQLEKTTKLVDGQYEVRLLWAEENATIHNSYFSENIRSFFLWNDVTSGERRVSQTTVRRDHQCGRAEWLC